MFGARFDIAFGDLWTQLKEVYHMLTGPNGPAANATTEASLTASSVASAISNGHTEL